MIKALLCSSGWPQTPESDLPPKWGDHRPAPFVHLFILGVKILAPSLQSPAWREVKWAVCVLQGMACYFRTFWLTARAKSATNNSCFPDSGGWMRDCANRKEGQISLLEKHLPGVTQSWGLWSSAVPGPPCLFLLPASSQTCAWVRAFSGVTHVLQRKCLRCFPGEQTCYSCPKRWIHLNIYLFIYFKTVLAM